MFEEKYREFLLEFGQGRKMVLSTSESGRVSSRMMSVVQIGGVFCFQTDRTMDKARQLKGNPRAALCIDNIQIEGVCREAGPPAGCEAFCRAYKECFPSSFAAYTFLEDERLFELRPLLIKRWAYIDKRPYTEAFDMAAGEYGLRPYRPEVFSV